jgi:putative flippase GtrA
MAMGPFIRRMFGPYPVAGRTARYTIVGAICALAHNAVMILGDLAGEHYVPMTVLSFGIVTPLGYLLHSRFTFREQLSLRAFCALLQASRRGFRFLSYRWRSSAPASACPSS